MAERPIFMLQAFTDERGPYVFAIPSEPVRCGRCGRMACYFVNRGGSSCCAACDQDPPTRWVVELVQRPGEPFTLFKHRSEPGLCVVFQSREAAEHVVRQLRQFGKEARARPEH